MGQANELIIPESMRKLPHQDIEQWAISKYGLSCSKCGSEILSLGFAGGQQSIEPHAILSASCMVASCGNLMLASNGLNPKKRN